MHFADRYWDNMPEPGGPDADVSDTREMEMRAFRFAAFPLRVSNNAAVRNSAPALRGHVRPRGALRARRRLGLGQSQVNRNGVSRELRGKLKVL